MVHFGILVALVVLGIVSAIKMRHPRRLNRQQGTYDSYRWLFRIGILAGFGGFLILLCGWSINL
jgi:hypothetical protein